MVFVDPYYDEKLGELRNLLNAKSAADFRDLEAQVVFANELELAEVDIPRTNNATELLAIHQQLFGNIYDWAGQIRTVDIRKNIVGAGYFLAVTRINAAFDFVLNELVKENCLCGLDRRQFIKRLAYFYDQLNYIHPFREGNGRVQRVFWGRVARDAGYFIDWDKVVGNENDEASRLAAETLDLSALIQMFDKIAASKQE
jgi:cell filamentation protein